MSRIFNIALIHHGNFIGLKGAEVDSIVVAADTFNDRIVMFSNTGKFEKEMEKMFVLPIF